MKYKLLALGGTFDHLHKGHEVFLRRAFTLAERVSIGITSDSMVRGKAIAQTIEPFALRKKAAEDFLRKEGLLSRSSFETLNDIYGITRDHPRLEAILVTKDTIDNAHKINQERKKRKLKSLTIEKVKLVLSTDRRPIASERIRKGEEDRGGRVFSSAVLGLSGRKLTPKARLILQKPFGTLIHGTMTMSKRTVAEVVQTKAWQQAPLCIVVGDAATVSFLQQRIVPDIAIVDLAIRRQPVYSSVHDLGYDKSVTEILAINPKSIVSKTMFTRVKQMIQDTIDSGKKSPKVMRVVGEEDLAVLPAVLFAPLESIVVYGQPPYQHNPNLEGLVAIIVTEERKQQVVKLLQSLLKLR